MASRAKKKFWRYRQQEINNELKSKLVSTGLVDAGTCINWHTTRQEKMSKVLLDFVEPYTAGSDSDEEFQRIVLVGILAWNIALLPAELRQESLAPVPPDAAADFQEIIDEMIERKEKCFAKNRRFILAHHWTMTTKGPHLSVVSTTGLTME
jgi:hypothetical protein